MTGRPSLVLFSCLYKMIVVCMVITYRKSKDQSGKVANPARGQLKRKN